MNEEAIMSKLSPEDRAAYAALAAAVSQASAMQARQLEMQRKSWLSKAADWVEDHPVAVLSGVLLLTVAAECYIYSRKND